MYDYDLVYSDIYTNYKGYGGGRILPHNSCSFPFIELNKDKFNSFVDVSSGKGEYIDTIKELIGKSNLKIATTDIKKFHSLDVDFIKLNLADKNDLEDFKKYRFDLLTCLGVLEHIEHNHIDIILETFSTVGKYNVITVANHSDKYKEWELHLIQEPISWWSTKIKNYFTILTESIIDVGSPDDRLFLFELERK